MKFTPTGGTVSLAVERNEDALVRLSVHDTGPGIPQDQRDVIFDVFRQLDASQTREHEGTGLGLAITRELVQLLGGEIQFESQTGKGSTFVVELPIQVSDVVEGPPIRLT